MRISDWSSDVCSSDLVEVGAQPVDDLLDAANLLAAFLRTQRRIGGEQHARIELDRRALAEPGERRHQQSFLSQRLPVAHRVVMERVRTAHPDRAAATFEPVVEDDARDLPALARAPTGRAPGWERVGP